jgi:hypothetical protein
MLLSMSKQDASWRTHPRKHLERKVGRTPWSAADAHAGLVGERVRGDPRGRGRPPHSAVNRFSSLLLCGTQWEHSCVLDRDESSARRRDESRRSRLRVQCHLVLERSRKIFDSKGLDKSAETARKSARATTARTLVFAASTL